MRALLRVQVFVCLLAVALLLPDGGPAAQADPPADASADASADAPVLVLTDVTDASGIGNVRGDRFSFADYDADGDSDLLVNGRTLLRNVTERAEEGQATIRFENITKASGLGAGPGGGAVWVDLDRDGDLDVVTTGGAIKIQVEPDRFEDRAKAWGLVLEDSMASVGVLDVDGDGRPEVLFGGGENWNDGDAVFFPRVLLENVEGQRFRERSKARGLDGGRYGRAVAQADYDRDGDLDVYLGNYRLQPNELFENRSGVLTDRAKDAGVQGRFTTDRATLPNGQKVGYHYGHTIGASWSDLDGDGDFDLWVSNLVHKFAGDYKGQYDLRGWICDDSAIYRNDGAPAWSFTDVRGESGIPLMPTGDRSVFRGDELWSHAACGDLDGDGLPEVFVTQVYKLPYSHSLLFRNLGGLRFEEVSADVGVRRFDSYGGALADLDGDGDLDLVTNGRGSPEGPREIRVYRNDTAPAPWIAFRLRGRGGDAMPIGAQVELTTTSGRRFVRQVEGAMGSHAQQNESALRFGLRGHEPAAVEARWPGGVVQALDVAELGRVHEIEYPDLDVPALRLDDPVFEAEDATWALRARATGASAVWSWRFDLDGDGHFETPSKDGRARVPATGAGEVRVRLWRKSRGVGREAVWRLPAPEGDG